jgi:glycosyltransferase involved in cell wall biosynthesis
LHEYVVEKGAQELVVFEGHVDEERKHEIYEQAWLLALPSIKEGWGLVVGEAGMHRTPTVAYRSAGGTRESVADGRSGRLVESRAGFTDTIARLLEDPAERRRLGEGALEMSHAFSWGHAQRSFALVALAAARGVRVDAQDPESAPTSAEDEASG